MKLSNNKKEGWIRLEELSGEEFFALMDEIRETMNMFRRWDMGGEGESL